LRAKSGARDHGAHFFCGGCCEIAGEGAGWTLTLAAGSQAAAAVGWDFAAPSIASLAAATALPRGFNTRGGDAVVIMMADASDAPADAVRYWHLLGQGFDCAFGSRFIKGGSVHDYPRIKLMVNRLANFFVRVGFNIPLNDTTNAFKAYRRPVIDGCRPFLAPHFNLTVEIPLKAIARGYSFTITPISWHNRKFGVAKLKIKEMGSRYFFICAYVWLEKYFSRGDYRRRT
jgi:dolichol-phosphate mannosyltransferase